MVIYNRRLRGMHQHVIEQHQSNCCLLHGAAVFAVRCISARWSAIQASQAVDVDGSRAMLIKLVISYYTACKETHHRRMRGSFWTLVKLATGIVIVA